jgi:Hemolysins and related proteins containing CBS domains
LLIEIALVLALTILNGLLAMSELAVVSARPARLRVLRDHGSKGAGVALALAETPGRFLSTVQIGITLVGILSGAFSGATLGVRLASFLQGLGWSRAVADAVGVGLVVVAITYLSLIVGELVPKQIALRHPERIAARVAPAMALLSRFAAPLVWLLDTSGDLLLRLLGQRGQSKEKVTEEELKSVIAEAEKAGVLESEERDMIAGVMRFADRAAKALMTPRRDVELLDLSDDIETIRAQARTTRRSRLPVRDEEPDAIVGIVAVKDLVPLLATDDPDIRSLIQEVPIVADNARALDVLQAMRASTVHMALVYDEYGHFEGIITSADVLEAITGAFQEEGEEEAPYVVREDGSFLVSGWMPIDEFADKIGAPVERNGDFETVAGLVLNRLNHLPDVGECFELGPWKYEVVDLDGRRIDKVLVSRLQ